MENIKIENTWDSDNVTREDCKCYSSVSSCTPTKTRCDDCHFNRNNSGNNILKSISCGSRLFKTSLLYAINYPNLIITKTSDSDLNIFDTIQNKIIFSSKNDLSEANQELIKRIKLNNPRYDFVHKDLIFKYDSTMMMEHFMIIKLRIIENNYGKNSYIIFNFKTHAYKIFMLCNLFYMYNDRTLFVFVTYGLDNLYNYKIITKSDIENNIDNIVEINDDKEDHKEIQCMCNSNILTFKLIKRIAGNHRDYSTAKSIYYDIKKQKFVYTSKNQFVGWRGDKLIEYDSELKKCNLISFTAINIPKKIINCDRCLDKFEKSSEEIIPEHKNICSLCIIKL